MGTKREEREQDISLRFIFTLACPCSLQENERPWTLSSSVWMISSENTNSIIKNTRKRKSNIKQDLIFS